GRADIAVISATQVVIFADVGGAAIPNVIWSKPNDSSTDPSTPSQVAVGFAVSFDNRYLSIAGNLGAWFTFDLTSGTTAGGDCACSPTGMFGMGGALYRLTGLKDGAVKILDASTNELWFVPLAVPSSVSEGGQQ